MSLSAEQCREHNHSSEIRIHNGSFHVERHFAGTKTAADLISEKLSNDAQKTFSRAPSLAFRRVAKYNSNTAFGQLDEEGR